MKLYSIPPSNNCRKVAAYLEHVGAEYETHVVDMQAGEHRSESFLAINPNGKVPALVDGDVNVWESNAMLMYLAEKFERPEWPSDERRWEVMRWLNWEAAHWNRHLGTIYFERLMKPMFGMGETDEALLEEATKHFTRFAGVLDGILSDGRTWLCGDEVTIADFSIGCDLMYAEPAQLDMDSFPHMKSWVGRFRETKGWMASQPE